MSLADELAASLRSRTAGGRWMVGIAGAPGAGKSTLAAAVVERLGVAAVLVPLDGFHLADDVLAALGRSDRKGAPDTFDVAGYLALLGRLRRPTEEVVYAPRFRRELELAEAGAIAVPPEVPVVVTEGNYLLGDEPFAAVQGLLDETWFVDVDDDIRRRRLVERHVRYGRSPEEAAAWVETTDEPNARLVIASRARADRVLTC